MIQRKTTSDTDVAMSAPQPLSSAVPSAPQSSSSAPPVPPPSSATVPALPQSSSAPAPPAPPQSSSSSSKEDVIMVDCARERPMEEQIELEGKVQQGLYGGSFTWLGRSLDKYLRLAHGYVSPADSRLLQVRRRMSLFIPACHADRSSRFFFFFWQSRRRRKSSGQSQWISSTSTPAVVSRQNRCWFTRPSTVLRWTSTYFPSLVQWLSSGWSELNHQRLCCTAYTSYRSIAPIERSCTLPVSWSPGE